VGIQRRADGQSMIVNLTTPNQNSFRIKGDSGTYKVSRHCNDSGRAQGACSRCAAMPRPATIRSIDCHGVRLSGGGHQGVGGGIL
jgi:hypothetical protein